MAEVGFIRDTTRFRSEGGGLSVFKIHKHRLACFDDGRDLVIIHGFAKKTKKGKRESRELKTAEALRAGYLDRKKEGS